MLFEQFRCGGLRALVTPLPLAPKGKPGGPLMITYHPLHHRLERLPAKVVIYVASVQA
jgi:hypothetical protein